MEQWLRDELAREEGYVICPIRFEMYTACNKKCEKCKDYIEFVECIKKRDEEKENGRR